MTVWPLAARSSPYAYANSPICAPSRASLATGRYVHEIRNWDNAFPYDGRAPAWGHRLQEQGYLVDSIGKLRYRGEEAVLARGLSDSAIPGEAPVFRKVEKGPI